eukprot:ANDGO_03579.mRNA.1 Protein cwh43
MDPVFSAGMSSAAAISLSSSSSSSASIGSTGSAAAALRAGFLLDLFASTMMWTLFTEVISLVWFFAVVQMDFSGYEVFLLSPLSLFALSLSSVRKLVLSRQHVLLMIGVFGFIAPFIGTPETKLVTVAIALAALLYHRFAAAFLVSDRNKRAMATDSIVMGLIITLLLRRMNGSLSPIYVSKGGAALVLIFGFGALLCGAESTVFSSILHSSAGSLPVVSSPQSSVVLGAAFGSLLYLTSFFATETAVHPRSAALPVDPYSGIVLLLACLAPLLPVNPFSSGASASASVGSGSPTAPMSSPSPVSPGGFPKTSTASAGLTAWYLCMCAIPATLFHWVPNGICTLLCSVPVMFYLISVWPYAVERCVASVNRHGIFFFTAMFVNLACMLMGVYSSVYKFVPGGYLLRECPWVPITLAAWLLYPLHSASSAAIAALDIRSFSCSYQHASHAFTGAVQDALNFISRKPSPKYADFVRQVCACILVFGVVFSSAYSVYWSVPHVPVPPPHPSGQNVLTTMVWNVRWAMDDAGSYSYDNIEKMIRAVDADVVGLIETEHCRVHSANRDSTEHLSKRLGMYGLHGPNPRLSSFGNELYSKYPFIEYDEFVLPSPEGEIAPAIEALIDVRGVHVRVFLTHFGNTEDVLDLKLQSEEMSRRVMLAEERGEKIVFLSYITSTMQGVPYTNLRNAGLLDSAPLDTHRYCEYLLYDNMQLVSYTDIHTSPVSDTEVLAAQFLVSGSVADAETLVDCCGQDGRYSAFAKRWPFGRRQSQWGFNAASGRLEREFIKNEDL